MTLHPAVLPGMGILFAILIWICFERITALSRKLDYYQRTADRVASNLDQHIGNLAVEINKVHAEFRAYKKAMECQIPQPMIVPVRDSIPDHLRVLNDKLNLCRDMIKKTQEFMGMTVEIVPEKRTSTPQHLRARKLTRKELAQMRVRGMPF